jgi:hypothetical protein
VPTARDILEVYSDEEKVTSRGFAFFLRITRVENDEMIRMKSK